MWILRFWKCCTVADCVQFYIEMTWLFCYINKKQAYITVLLRYSVLIVTGERKAWNITPRRISCHKKLVKVMFSMHLILDNVQEFQNLTVAISEVILKKKFCKYALICEYIFRFMGLFVCVKLSVGNLVRYSIISSWSLFPVGLNILLFQCSVFYLLLLIDNCMGGVGEKSWSSIFASFFSIEK